MAKRIPVALAVYAVLVAMVLAGTASPIEARSGGSVAYVPDQIIVRFADDLDAQGQAQINSRNGGQEVDQLGGIGAKLVRVAAGSVELALRAYRAESRVRYAEPNYIVHAISPIRRPLAATPSDTSFGQLWGLRNTGQLIGGGGGGCCYGAPTGTAGADIKAEPAWDITTGSKTIVVGVVDTGIDYNHPDLAANVWSNPGAIGGCAAGTHGFRAINLFTTSCDPLDDNNHGTHVSGTIGAVGNNGVGVVGVNWNVSLMGLKFLSASGSGYTSDAIKVINFAVDAKIAGVNVRVLSNSWGGGGFSQALLDSINRANANDILFVAAAGNSATDNDTTPSYPASYDALNVLAVAATTNTDGLASFSSYGLKSVDLGAPGQDILSTTRNNTYAYFSGTSMATPHVSGAAALVLSQGYLSVSALKSKLLSSVDAIPSLSGKTVTGGRLNLCKAISGCGVPPTPDYSLSVSPASATVAPGASAIYTVTVTPSGGFNDTVTFSASDLPTGATAEFNPISVATSGSSTMTVATLATTPTGNFPLTITGTSESLTPRTTVVTLVVTAAPTPTFTISATPTSRTIKRGSSTTYAVNIARAGGFTGAVTFSVAGLGAGQAGTFSPNPATENSSTLTISTTANAATGSRVLTITGVSGTLSRATTVTLVVRRGNN